MLENLIISGLIVASILLPLIVLAAIGEWFVTRTKTGRAFERWLFRVLDVDVDNVDDEDK